MQRPSQLILLGLAWLTLHSVASADGVWISPAELQAIPTKGPAWNVLEQAARRPAPPPHIADQSERTDVLTLAQALVGVRTGDAQLIAQARRNVLGAIGTERGGTTLALGRNLACYVIAADLVGLEGGDDAKFRDWLRRLLDEKQADGRSLRSCHEQRPNNWGTMAGASRAAVAAYLNDRRELDRTAQVFRGWLGDRAQYDGFRFGGPERDLSWQVDPARPVGVNPRGAMKDGHALDGALPEELRRGGPFQWPPAPTGYCWEALQGALVQAEILHRQGYRVYEAQDQALRRAVAFLYQLDWPAVGDDRWQVWIINRRYAADYEANPRPTPGKIMGWTSWTHAAR